MEEYEVIEEFNENEISDYESNEEFIEEVTEEVSDISSDPETEVQGSDDISTTDISLDSSSLDFSSDSASYTSSVDMTDLLKILNEVVHNNVLASEASSEGSSEGSLEGGSVNGSEGSSFVEIIDYSGYLDSISGQLDLALDYASTYQSNYLIQEANNSLDSQVDDIGLTNTLMLFLIVIGLSSMCVHFARGLF